MSSAEEMLAGKYPAKEHARRVAASLRGQGLKPGMLYLEAQKTRMKEDSDEAMHFRQRRYFFYLTGCELPDCYFTYDTVNDKSILFIPPIDPDEVIWSGLPITEKEALEKYDVDAVLPSTEVNPYLASKQHSQFVVYAISHQVSEHITFLNFADKDWSQLKQAIDQCRVEKSSYEIALIRHANEVSTAGHIAAMKAAKQAKTEQELYALFLKTCVERGCEEMAYHPIFAAGTAAATLHYVKNDQPLQGKANILIDAGAESRCYASDITRTFPLNGRFSPETKALYQVVLRMQEETIGMIKAGVSWDELHSHAHRVAIAGLLELGILQGDAQEIFDEGISVAFFPHGLGHFLGMDTHDVGGQPNPKDDNVMFRYLRLRVPIPTGSVVTVEPGIYFCRFIIEPYLQSEHTAKFINTDVLEKYWDVGGIRIEDNILVTKDGHENLTTTPKTVEDIEAIMA